MKNPISILALTLCLASAGCERAAPSSSLSRVEDCVGGNSEQFIEIRRSSCAAQESRAIGSVLVSRRLNETLAVRWNEVTLRVDNPSPKVIITEFQIRALHSDTGRVAEKTVSNLWLPPGGDVEVVLYGDEFNAVDEGALTVPAFQDGVYRWEVNGVRGIYVEDSDARMAEVIDAEVAEFAFDAEEDSRNLARLEGYIGLLEQYPEYPAPNDPIILLLSTHVRRVRILEIRNSAVGLSDVEPSIDNGSYSEFWDGNFPAPALWERATSDQLEAISAAFPSRAPLIRLNRYDEGNSRIGHFEIQIDPNGSAPRQTLESLSEVVDEAVLEMMSTARNEQDRLDYQAVDPSISIVRAETATLLDVNGAAAVRYVHERTSGANLSYGAVVTRLIVLDGDQTMNVVYSCAPDHCEQLERDFQSMIGAITLR